MTDPPDALRRLVRLPENRAARLAVSRLLRHILAARHRAFPLVCLHGAPGTGKSHLAGGLVERLVRLAPDRSARLVPAADLGRAVSEGRVGGTAEAEAAADAVALLGAARDCDLLVIEDIQHLPENAAWGVADLLDARERAGRPTLVTAAQGPGRLRELPSRLTSRLSCGLVCHLEPIGPRSRRHLTRRLVRRAGLYVTPAVIARVAAARGGVRPIVGAIRRLEQLARVMPPPLGEAAIVALDAADGPDGESGATPVSRVVGCVARHFGLGAADLTGPARHRHLLWPRHLAMHLARESCGLSLPAVGRAFGGRNHTSVLHACRRAARRLADEPDQAALARQLLAEIGSGGS